MSATTASSSPPAAPPYRRVTVVVLVAAVLAGVLGWWAGPAPASPGPERTGDPALADRLRGVAGPGQYGLVAAVVENGTATYAGIGDDGRGIPVGERTPFEIGSVTKTVTGAVLAGLERDGVVRGSDRIRDVAPDRAWGPLGEVTLGELSAHLSGLPVQAVELRELPSRFGNGLLGLAPREHTPEQVFDAAATATLGPRGESVYSNLGNALLGQLLAERSGTPYPRLVERYVTGPLGMTATGIPGAPPPGAAVGHDPSGRPMAPWISAGDAPAGTGVWSTATDLVRYVAALDDPRSPVAVAAQPRHPSDYGRIGYGWYIVEVGGHTLLWKNGGSGGVSSSVLAEPSTGRAVVVLGNSFTGVDRIAAELLGVPSPFGAASDSGSGPGALIPWVVAMLFPLAGGAGVVAATRGGWRRSPRPVRRLDVLTALGGALGLLALGRVAGAVSWLAVPFFVLGCALTGAGLALAVLRWRSWGPDDGPGRTGRLWNAGFSLTLGVAAAGAVAGAAALLG